MGSNESGASRATDMSSLHRYRTEIPNLIDEMDLSVYAFRLYVRLKRVAGDSGRCFYSTRQLAEQCRMSVGAVSKAKQELIAADLIRIERDGEWERDNITIVDLWPANFAYFAQEKEPKPCSPHEQTPEKACSPHEQDAPPLCSPHEQSVHHMNTPVHHMNTKEEPYKERTIKKEPKGKSAPSPDADVDFGGKALTPQQTMFAAICEAMGWDYRIVGLQDKQPVGELVSDLSKAGYTADDVRRFMVEVWFKDWRWEKRQERPKLKDIRQGIGALRLGLPENVPRPPASGRMAPVDRGKAAADELRAMLLANGKGDILG